MRRLAIIGVALAAMLALAAIAVAQVAPVITVTGSGSPTDAGTKKKPKNGTIKVAAKVNEEANVTADQITFLLPQHAKLSGTGFKFCPKTKIDNEGEASCPSGSKVGTGTARALVGPNKTVFNFTINIYAGSKNELALRLSGPITKTLRGIISSVNTQGYGQKITVDIPPEVQQPIPGLYASITDLGATIGPKSATVTKRINGKRRRVKVYFVSSIGCPSDRTHNFGVRMHFVANPNPPAKGDAEGTSTANCTP